MTVANPFAEFRSTCEAILREALKKRFPEAEVSLAMERPPVAEFGELSFSAFELAKLIGKKPLEVAEQVAKAVDLSGVRFVKSVRAAGGGYVNFYVNLAEFAELTLGSAVGLGEDYGFVGTVRPTRVIVEHTSANPIRPIHVGTARNSVLGDVLARILVARGHTVFRHYYVDDVGRQAAVIAYGYQKLGEPVPDGKPDHFIGVVYAVTSCIVEVERLKKAIGKTEGQGEGGEEVEVSKLRREVGEWVAASADLQAAHPQLFTQLLDKIRLDENPDAKIAELNLEYEKGEREAKQLIRRVSELCLRGFKGSLGRIGVFFDSWDWESDFVWNGDVKRVLAQLQKTPFVYRLGGVLEFNVDKAAQDLGVKPLLGLREDHEIPSLTLVRADGSTLYTTRDVAYNLWKFRKAEQVVNVIATEQTLPQMQLKVALCVLGHGDEARNLRHFAYNLVSLPGYKMSGRMGRYITLDETVDEAVKRAYDEVVKRSPQLSEIEKQRISNLVGVGALKYALVQVDPSKPVVFTWDRVLDFEKNSGPYIQYTYARAGSILRKAEKKPENPDYALLKEPIERDLVLILARFPDVFVDSAENLRPNEIADYVNALADKFNSFYGALPVIRAKPVGLSDARLALVEAVKIVLRNALGLLGIEAPEKM